MELNTLERIVLLNLLPKEGDIVTLRVVKEVQEEVGFKGEELEALNFKNTPQGGMMWDTKAGEKTIEVKIGKAAVGILLGHLKSLSESKRLPIDALSLYDKLEGKEKG